jgi:putative tricarboxylic transport membrane protein
MSLSFDRYVSFLFLIIGMGFIFESRKISETAYGSNVGPNVFPMALGIILILLSFRLFFETRNRPSTKDEKVRLDYKKFLVIVVSAILYGLLLEVLGYVITTFLFLVVGFQVMEKGRWINTILIAGVFSFGVYYVFVQVLKGSLPGFPIFF